jgi:formylglycine-generating enzyme required for sulfatase activity
MPKKMVDLTDPSYWWKWTIGANWRHPEGPGSDITERMDHPVVHVSFEDASAYAAWAGKSLPTEAEWEYASRGGRQNERYHWGNDDASDSTPPCNIWQGQFPIENTLADGALRTNAVGSYPPNAFGLHDMAGNVWEWCADKYRADAYELESNRITEQPNNRNHQPSTTDHQPLTIDPKGPDDSWDPNDPVPTVLKHVIRGGSFLCHRGYCESYRNSARRGESPDTGMSHIGFRLVVR